MAELTERQRIFLDILRLSGEIGVQFAFPTETQHIANLAGEETDLPASVQTPETH
jgi:hypothetical protein